MSIRFPKLHIAESVVNRILNVADGLPDTGSTAARIPASPPVADPATLGANLNVALSQPLTGPLPGIEAAPEVATGKPLLNTLIEGQGQ